MAAAKHCPHGFDLDIEGKDSCHFKEAGAQGVFLASPTQIGLVCDKEHAAGIGEIGEHYFPDFDLVLAEGFAGEEAAKKIEVLRREISTIVQSPREELLAVVADFDITTGVPSFKLEEIPRIVDFLEGLIRESKGEGPHVELKINGKPTSLNAFVQDMITNVVTGLVVPLKREEERVHEIEIKISSEEV